jgi:DNA-binding protein H-NS
MLGGGNSWSGPSFDVDLFIVVAALVFATGWLLIAIARLKSAYQAGIRNTTSLKRQQISEAKEMMKLTQEALRLEEEIKQARAAAEKTAKELEERKKMLGEQPVATAAPAEVYVASEFASSKKEKPWIAHMKRTGANRARRPGEATARFVLVWAADHPSALGRARGLVANDTDYEVEGLRPFTAT